MSEEVERSDTYYEVQVDRETLVLLGFGFVALLVAAFLVGRWTAPAGAVEDPAAAVLLEDPAEGEQGERSASHEIQDVDGEPLFGGSPVSAEGAPPIGAVPEQPLPDKEVEVAATPASPTAAPERARESKPPSVAATASKETIPTAAAEGWVVQVAAVKSSRDARALQDRLEAKGWPVRVIREGGYSKVQVGPFGKRSEADGAERRLKSEDRLSTWVKHS